MLVGNKEELNKKFNLYEFVMFFLIFVVYTVAAMLITPFVMIYTYNVNDANYYQPLFGVLILISEAMYVLKLPHVNLAYSANKFKEMTIPAYIEAGLNIIISIIFVSKFGLIGVAIGTLVAMTYRTIYQVVFLKKHILNRSSWIFFKKFILFTIIAIIGTLICTNFFATVENTILSWLIHAIAYTLIILAIYIVVALLFYKKDMKAILNYIKR